MCTRNYRESSSCKLSVQLPFSRSDTAVALVVISAEIARSSLSGISTVDLIRLGYFTFHAILAAVCQPLIGPILTKPISGLLERQA